MIKCSWHKAFEENKTIEDIPDKVKKLESSFWIWLGISSLITILGILIMMVSQQSNFGLFFAIVGVVNIALIKIWAHIWLSTYRILWDIHQSKK